MALPPLQSSRPAPAQVQARDWKRAPSRGEVPAGEQAELVGRLGKQIFPLDESVYGEKGYEGNRIFVIQVGNQRHTLRTGHKVTARPGDSVVAVGRWGMYKNEKQFQALVVDLDMPRDVKGTAKWLEKLPGFGKVTVRKLADHFGEELSEAVCDAERLVASGIVSAKKAAVAAEIAKAQRPKREVFSYLHGLGIGESVCSKIIDVWGMATRSYVQKNPWSLASVVEGVGFKTADEIARKQSPDAERSADRIVAALQAAVKEGISSEGHTGLTVEEAVEGASRLTTLPQSLIAPHAEAAFAGDRFVIDPFTLLVSTKAMHAAESEFADRIMALMEAPGIDPARAERALAKAEARVIAEARKEGRTLAFHPNQLAAALQALTCNVSIITGGPGTGKSTILKLILEALKELDRDVVLAAPTGRAAKRMQEAVGDDFPTSTCHRLLQFQNNDASQDGDNPFEEDWFVVDEVSMMDQRLARDFVRPIRTGSGLTLIGDVDQLPPVGPGQVLRDMISSGVVPVTRLTQIYRQEGESGIIVAARTINRGESPLLEKEIRGFHMIAADDEVQATDKIVHWMRTKLPDLVAKGRFKGEIDLANDVQVLAAQRKGPAGVDALNRLIKESLNPPSSDGKTVEMGDKSFTVGDRVMQTVNNYAKKVYNGEVGTVVEVGIRVPKEEDESKGRRAPPRKPEPCFTVDFSGHRATYVRGDLQEIEAAYATTVHKSQGSQYRVIILSCPLEHAYAYNRNLLYTAVTRASELCIVVGKPVAVQRAAAKQMSQRRRTGLVERLRAMAPVLDLRDAEPEMGEPVAAPAP